MGLFSRIFYFFAPYTDVRERRVSRFFNGLTERSNQSKTRAKLDKLLQDNIAIINLWTEYRYKGYRYLTKSQRKKLYAYLGLIAEDFDRFYAESTTPADTIISHIHRIAPRAHVDPERIMLLQALMDYFSPRRGLYIYRESSSFGRLLRDPAKETLIGDCNQIVTLYIYLYSRHYDVHDLQVRTIPGHVALHYGDIDIETTNGTFADYSGKKDSALLPIEEIVSINLLDTTDSYLATHEIDAKDLLQASRFAFILSHDRDIITRNLLAAYSQLINTLMKRHNYKQALKFAIASHDRELLGVVGHNGAVYEMKRNNYAAARHFAQHASDAEELIRISWQSEGVHLFQAQRYHDAVKALKHINDQELIGKCYAALFFEEQKKLGKNPTIDSIKQGHIATVRRMHDYAKKSGNKQLIEYITDLQKNLRRS